MDSQETPPPSNPQPQPQPNKAELSRLLNKLIPAAAPQEADTASQAGEAGWSLPKLVGMVRRKAWVIGVLAIACSAYMGFRDSKHIVEYQSSFRLLVEPVNQKRDLQQLTDDKAAPTTQELDYSTQIEVLYSPKVLKPIFAKVSERYPGTTFDSTVGKLSVTRLGETKIIEVGYTDTNPDKIQYLLEKLSKGYLDYSLNEQQAQLRQGLNFVNKQLPGIQNRVNSLQQQIQDLQQKYNFTDPDAYSEQLMTQLGAIAQQRQAIRSDLAALQVQYAGLQQKLGETNALSASSNYQTTLQQFQVLERQLAIESARFGTRNPSILLLQRQQANLLPILLKQAEEAVGIQQAAVANQIQMLIARDQAIASAERILSTQFKQMPSVSRLYAELQRELGIATASLTRFLETQERLQIQAAQNEVPWQLIAEPSSPQPKSSSSLYKTLVMGAIAGMFVGIVVAFLLEKLENTYYTVEELKARVKLPLIGLIPFNPDLEEAEPRIHIVDLGLYHENGQSLTNTSSDLKQRVKLLLNAPEKQEASVPTVPAPTDSSEPPAPDEALDAAAQVPSSYWLSQSDAYGFLEAFRTLYTNLKRQEGQTFRGFRSLVISSALPTEGRTTVAVHLVQAAAAMGRRVLLVDAHFRRAGTQVHTLLGLQNTIGLSHCLNDSSLLNQAIQRLSWEANLFVISAGETPPDPTRLLASPQMHELMARLRKNFDLVVYDTPPLMGLADVSLIASKADAILLVASLGKRGSSEALKQTIERLQVAHLPVLGVVANRVRDYSVDLYTQGT